MLPGTCGHAVIKIMSVKRWYSSNSSACFPKVALHLQLFSPQEPSLESANCLLDNRHLAGLTLGSVAPLSPMPQGRP